MFLATSPQCRAVTAGRWCYLVLSRHWTQLTTISVGDTPGGGEGSTTDNWGTSAQHSAAPYMGKIYNGSALN